MGKIKAWLQTPRLWELFRFAVTGGVSFLVDWSVMMALDKWVFSENLHWLSIAIGFTVSVIVNYLLCVVWVFKGVGKQSLRSQIVFVGSSVVGLGLTELFMFLLEFWLQAWLAKPIVTLLVMIWNYFMKRLALYGFKKKPNQNN